MLLRKRDPIKGLARLLEHEKRLLLMGRIEGLSALMDQKEKLLREVAELVNADPERLEAIEEQIEKNQELLKAAASGIQGVMDRLKAMHSVRESLITYDYTGRMNKTRSAGPMHLDDRS